MTFGISITNNGKDLGTQWQEAVLKNILEKIKRDIKEGRLLNFRKINADLTNAVRNSYKKAVRFAADNLIGAASGRGTTSYSFTTGIMNNYGANVSNPVSGTTAEPRGRVTWPSLDYATQKKKGHNKYFVDTGKLRAFLRRSAGPIVDGTGVIRVEGADTQERVNGRFGQRRIKLANMHIKVMPNIPSAFLPGIKANNIGVVDKNMRFEMSVIEDEKMLDKLMGPSGDKRRHLLQPVFTFWTNYYIPREVSRTLRNRLK